MENLDEATIRAIYERWNAKDLDGVLAAFSDLGPGGFTVEYIGQPPIEGTAAVQDMWKSYGGTCTTDVATLIVNGSEAAALIHNNLSKDGAIVTMHSIETYRRDGDRLFVRYFHHTPE